MPITPDAAVRVSAARRGVGDRPGQGGVAEVVLPDLRQVPPSQLQGFSSGQKRLAVLLTTVVVGDRAVGVP
ncbi:hypothetical protein [Streptomyces sp. NPDC056672]|uniref:hypothetical protein n=1 Tax=Streptomyces sp. NPDC056672 TaxID=3345906 RepID=UPI0036989FCD